MGVLCVFQVDILQSLHLSLFAVVYEHGSVVDSLNECQHIPLPVTVFRSKNEPRPLCHQTRLVPP